MFGFFKKRRRQKLLAEPVSEGTLKWLDRIPWRHGMSASQQERHLHATRIFASEKTFEGCNGLEVTEEMKVLIAGLASSMVIAFDDFYFDNVETILLYPTGYRARVQQAVGGAIMETDSERLGEAHYRGPVILSWQEIELDIEQPGYAHNLVVHEFAHQLDMMNGEANGVPILPKELQGRWQTEMAREFERLARKSERGRETFLDPYGATNPAEFFAVLSEYFFDVPHELSEEHPVLFDLLKGYYRVNPREWMY